MSIRRTLLLAIIVTVVHVVTAAPVAANAPPLPVAVQRYEATGRIVAFHEERATVSIAHDAIPGFMGAMTMRFAAGSATQLAGLAVDDDVVFTFSNDRGHRVIEQIAKRPRTKT